MTSSITMLQALLLDKLRVYDLLNEKPETEKNWI